MTGTCSCADGCFSGLLRRKSKSCSPLSTPSTRHSGSRLRVFSNESIGSQVVEDFESSPKSLSSRVSSTLRLWEWRGSERRIEDFYEHPEHLGEGAFGTVTKWKLKSSGISFDWSRDASRNTIEELPDAVSLGSFCRVNTPPLKDKAISTYSMTVDSYYAVKQIRWQSIWQKREVQREHEDTIRKELTTLIGLDHPNIAMIREWFEDRRDGIFFVMELCEGGSMQDVLENEVCVKETLEERLECSSHLQRIVRELSYAVSYIHSQGVVHRDLKPENVMLSSTHADSSVKLIDFGLAALVEGEGEGSSWQQGTMLFMAPELFLKSGGSFTEKSDMWSMGILLAWVGSALHSANLYHPMLSQESGEGFNVAQYELYCAYREQELPHEAYIASMPDCFTSLVSALLRYSSEDRASAADCLQNAWVAEGGTPTSEDVLASSMALENLVGWSKLKEADRSMLSLVASNLHDSHTGELARVFEAIDTDKTGHISRSELLEACEKCQTQFSKQNLEDLFNDIDTDGSGTIDYQEWLCATASQSALTSKTALLKAFDSMDTQGAGKIRAEQLTKLVGQEEATKIARHFSRRPSLSLEPRDFGNAMRTIASKRADATGSMGRRASC